MTTNTVPTRDWLVRCYTDKGPGEFYRYVVSGENLNHPVGHPDRFFSWSVPSLCERFNLDHAIAVANDDHRHWSREPVKTSK